MPRDGTKNLIPLNKRTKEEQKAIVTQGGIASGIARNRNKTFKEELLMLLDMDDNLNRMSVAVVKKALDGDLKALEIIRDTVGQKPSDKVENINIEVSLEDYVNKVEDTNEY